MNVPLAASVTVVPGTQTVVVLVTVATAASGGGAATPRTSDGGGEGVAAGAVDGPNSGMNAVWAAAPGEVTFWRWTDEKREDEEDGDGNLRWPGWMDETAAFRRCKVWIGKGLTGIAN